MVKKKVFFELWETGGSLGRVEVLGVVRFLGFIRFWES